MNEWVLRYVDQPSAAAAFAELHRRWTSCRDPSLRRKAYSFVEPVEWPGQIDRMFVSERGMRSAPGHQPALPAEPGLYQVGLVRDGNLVVLLESTGWADRTTVSLELALERAIPAGRGPCDVSPGPPGRCYR